MLSPVPTAAHVSTGLGDQRAVKKHGARWRSAGNDDDDARFVLPGAKAVLGHGGASESLTAPTSRRVVRPKVERVDAGPGEFDGGCCLHGPSFSDLPVRIVTPANGSPVAQIERA